MKDTFKFLQVFVGVFGLCPPCTDDENAPSYLCDPCESTVFSGGIAGWVAKKCSYTFVDIEDETEWETAIANKDVFGRVNGAYISGGLPDPEFSEVTRGACQISQVRKQTRTVTLLDVENDATFSIDGLYNFLASKYKGYEFGFVTCDGRFLGFYSNVYVKTWVSMTETNEGDTVWHAEFRYDEQIGSYSQMQLSFLLETVLNVCWIGDIALAGFGGATTVANGATLQIVATIAPTNATDPTVTWSVINGSGTATIDANGLLTGTGAGTVTVVATANDQSGVTETLVITVT